MDLFGETAVSLRDIELWLYKVPRLPHYSIRRAAYVRGYNVTSKIARAKEANDLDRIFGDESCEFCGQRLCADEITPTPSTHPADELARLKRRISVLEMVLVAATLPPIRAVIHAPRTSPIKKPAL